MEEEVDESLRQSVCFCSSSNIVIVDRILARIEDSWCYLKMLSKFQGIDGKILDVLKNKMVLIQ